MQQVLHTSTMSATNAMFLGTSWCSCGTEHPHMISSLRHKTTEGITPMSNKIRTPNHRFVGKYNVESCCEVRKKL